MANTISNQSQVSYSFEGSNETKTNISNVVTTTLNDKLSILVDKTSTSDCFKPGDNITYFVHITNNGCSCLGRFLISDNLGGETGVNFVAGSARLFYGGSMSAVTETSINPLEFEINERLARGEEMFLQYTVSVGSEYVAEQIHNEVSVKAYPCNCEENKNAECVTETACLTLERCQFAEILINKSHSKDNLCCGDEFDYYITLTNIGNIDAKNVVVTDTMPTEFNATEVHMENNGVHYQFLASEYSIDANNKLTVPIDGGNPILVPSLKPGFDNTTRIRVHGHI